MPESYYLCISVTLLDQQFHGTTDNDLPEWPPSPFRLFQSLLAGACSGRHQREWDDDVADAFRWLEAVSAVDPPTVLAPSAHMGTAYVINPPNNDSDEKPERQDRLTTKRFQPVYVREQFPLHYVWKLMQPSDTQQAERLINLVRTLHTFGRGIDPACATGALLTQTQVETLVGRRWTPRSGTTATLRRTPKVGTLDDLQVCHKTFLNRIQGDTYHRPKEPSEFSLVGYEDRDLPSARPHVVFTLRRLSDVSRTANFRPKLANLVAAMLRSAVCRVAEKDVRLFPGGSESFVAGHVGKDDRAQRFSYFVLPTIGHPHADGLIRRVMIAEQPGGDGTQVAWATERLRGLPLINDEQKAVAILDAMSSADNVIKNYCGTGRIWKSVTPIILPGFDDVKGISPDKTEPTKAERLLIKSLVHAGIEAESIESFSLHKAPSWPGTLHPRLYRRPSYLNDHRSRPGWHVTISFRQAVSGPIAIGAGRHCGLGILAISD